jgi:hypothetical protein
MKTNMYELLERFYDKEIVDEIKSTLRAVNWNITSDKLEATAGSIGRPIVEMIDVDFDVLSDYFNLSEELKGNLKLCTSAEINLYPTRIWISFISKSPKDMSKRTVELIKENSVLYGDEDSSIRLEITTTERLEYTNKDQTAHDESKIEARCYSLRDFDK